MSYSILTLTGSGRWHRGVWSFSMMCISKFQELSTWIKNPMHGRQQSRKNSPVRRDSQIFIRLCIFMQFFKERNKRGLHRNVGRRIVQQTKPLCTPLWEKPHGPLKWKCLSCSPQHALKHEHRSLQHYYNIAVWRRQGLVCVTGRGGLIRCATPSSLCREKCPSCCS